MSDLGHGSTITFGTSGFSAELMSLSGPSIERASVETTHMGTTTAKTFTPGDIYDGGSITCEFQYDAGDTPPVAGAAETITIAWGGSGTFSFSGFMTSYSINGEQGDNLMTASMGIKVTGAVTFS